MELTLLIPMLTEGKRKGFYDVRHFVPPIRERRELVVATV